MVRVAPKLIRWDITSKCNLSCKHCCVSNYMNDASIADLTYDDLVRALVRVTKAGVKAVHFLGGEPSIRPDFLELLRVANELGLAVSFNTNGIRCDANYVDAIFKYNVKKVVVSIDGYDAATHDMVRGKGTFDRAIRFLQTLLGTCREMGTNQPSIQIQSVLTKMWASDAQRMVKLAGALGVGSLKVNHLSESGNALENIQNLQVKPKVNFYALLALFDEKLNFKKLHLDIPAKAKVIQYFRESRKTYVPVDPFECPSPDTTCCIDPQGRVLPCQLADLQGMGDALPKVNIVTDKACDIWNSAYFDRFEEHIKNRTLAHLYKKQIPCNSCVFLGNGCQPCPLPNNKGFYPTNYMCLIASELIKKANTLGGYRFLTNGKLDNVIGKVIKNNPPRPNSECFD